MKESEQLAFFSAIAVSTTIINVNLITIYGLANYHGLLPIVTNTNFMIVFFTGVGFLNYFLFLRQKKFLRYNFQKDKKGGWLIVIMVVITFVISFVEAQYNRERISKDKTIVWPSEPRKESLEGDIKKWLNDK